MYIQAWRLFKPILLAKRILTALVLGSVLFMIGMDYAFNWWAGRWWTSLQRYDTDGIVFNLGLFSILALIYVLIYGLSSYWSRMIEFNGREILYEKFKLVWKESGCSNPEQRLSEDVLLFSQLSLNLIKAFINALIKIPLFLYVLFTIASWWVAVALLAYAIVGTIISRMVATKLINLEILQQRLEAVFRKQMTYAVDGKAEMPTLDGIKGNWLQLAGANKRLSWVQSLYDQIGVIVPYLLLLGLYLKKVVDLGGLRRVVGAAQEVLSSLSILVNSRDLLVQLSMVLIRLKELETGDKK